MDLSAISMDLPAEEFRHSNRRLPSRSRERSSRENRQHTNRSRERDRSPRISSFVNIEDDGTWTEVNTIRTANGGTCIDLTNGNSTDDDIVDLTSPTADRELRPVVLGGSRSNSVSPRRRRQNQNQRQSRRSRQNDSDNATSVINNSVHVIDNSISVIDQDNKDLPDPGLTSTTYQPELDTSADTSINSPGARKITCPICMDDHKQIRRSGRQMNSTVCGHLFCNHCIRSAINAQHKCPTCRKKLNLRQIHPIFI